MGGIPICSPVGVGIFQRWGVGANSWGKNGLQEGDSGLNSSPLCPLGKPQELLRLWGGEEWWAPIYFSYCGIGGTGG